MAHKDDINEARRIGDEVFPPLPALMTEPEARALSPEDRRSKLKELRRLKRQIKMQLELIEETCQHVVKEIPGDYYKKDKWRSDSTSCENCGLSIGWYCPKAPDHFCHYDDDDESETYDPCRDTCLFCGNPDERK